MWFVIFFCLFVCFINYWANRIILLSAIKDWFVYIRFQSIRYVAWKVFTLVLLYLSIVFVFFFFSFYLVYNADKYLVKLGALLLVNCQLSIVNSFGWFWTAIRDKIACWPSECAFKILLPINRYKMRYQLVLSCVRRRRKFEFTGNFAQIIKRIATRSNWLTLNNVCLYCLCN